MNTIEIIGEDANLRILSANVNIQQQNTDCSLRSRGDTRLIIPVGSPGATGPQGPIGPQGPAGTPSLAYGFV